MPPMSMEQFGQSIKAKHPEYGDIGDAELGQKVLAKYPQYQDMVSTTPTHVQQLMARTPGNYASQIASNVAGGIGDLVSGLYSTVRHPIDTATGIKEQAKTFATTPEDEASWQGNLLKAAENAPIIGGLVQQAEKGGTQSGSPEAIGAGVRAATQVAVPVLAGKAAIAIPRTARAAAKFEAVKAAAGDLPVDPNAAGVAALRAQEIANAGARMPKVLKNFIERTTDPDKAPLTYNDARDFYSNATEQTVWDRLRTSARIKSQMGQFTDALGNSISDTAGQVGMRDTLAEAMREYRNAKRVQNAAKVAVAGGVGALGYSRLKNHIAALLGY